MEFLLCKNLNMVLESYFECFVLSSVSFFKNLIHFSVLIMEQATISHKGEKVRSYVINFKREVVDFAKKKSILAAT